MFYDKIRKKWRVQKRVGNKRPSRYFDDHLEGQIFELQLKAGHVKFEAKPTTGKGCTFDAFSERWLKEYCRVEKAESQWKEDASVIKHHLSPAFGALLISSLKKSHLIELKATLREKTHGKRSKPLSAKSINNIVALAKKMLSTAVDMDLIPVSPFVNVKLLKMPKRKFDFWTPQERDRFLDACYLIDEEFADVVLVACHTGMRLGELSALKRRDLDFDRKKIQVGASWSRKLNKHFDTTKNKQVEDVPMNQAVYDVLFDRIKESPDKHVFDRPLMINALRKLQTICKMTDQRVIRFHDLRHTFASCLAMAGVDLMVIQKLMRHKSYQMTLRYAHLHPEHLKGSTEVLAGTQTARRFEAVN